MASVEDIGKRFNLSTKKILQRKLEDFENITKELFDSLATSYSQRGCKNDSIEKILNLVNDLIEKDAQIKFYLDIALKQLERYKQFQKVKEDISIKDQEIMLLQSHLKEAESVLSSALFQANRKLETMQQAKSASFTCEDLIKFAFRISSGNSVEAPPDWLPGDPRRPYPLDIEMRCGALGQLSQKGPQHGLTLSAEIESTTENLTAEKESQDQRKSIDLDDPMSTQTDSSSRNDGIWQGPPKEDTAHLATMPVSAMMSHPTNGNAGGDEVEFMSTSSDSSSSGDSS